jgi:DNA-binding response OmpR family regulator
LHLIQKSLDNIEYCIREGRNCFTGWKSLRSSRLSVLVVEDVPSLLEIYCAHLRQDYDPIGCKSIAEARAIIKSRAIDAVLTDFHLEDGSGMALLREYDSLWPEGSPPIIFLSADKTPDVRDAALRFGAEFFVEKPVRREQLIETIKLAMDRSMMRNARMTRSFGRHVDALVSPKVPKALGYYRLEIAATTATLGGGDIILLHKHQEFDRLIIVDVMGHGVPAKAWAVAYAAIINTLQREKDVDAAGFLTRLSALAWNDKSLESALATVLVLDIDQDGATIASAGHPSPVVIGKEIYRVSVGGPLFGVMPPCSYNSSRIRLNPGERLALFTDGIDPIEVAAGGDLPAWLQNSFAATKDASLQDAIAAVSIAAAAALGPQPNDDWLIAILEKSEPAR